MEGTMGQVVLFAGNFAPQNWMQCNGTLLPIAQYSALFSILGTTFGGDGIQTFALPTIPPQAGGNGGTLLAIICVSGIYPSRG